MTKLLIFEFVCGGGFQGKQPSEGLLRQGREMLQAALEDFSTVMESVSVYTVLEQRFAFETSAAVRYVEPQEPWRDAWQEQLRASDAVLVIAPESEGELEALCTEVVREGKISLNCTPDSIRLCTDKKHLCAHLMGRGIPVVETCELGLESALPDFGVIKPRDGAGCEDTYRLPVEGSLIQNLDGEREWIWQPWVPGESVSLSLLFGDNFVEVLSHNQVPCEIHNDGRVSAPHVEVGALNDDVALRQTAMEVAAQVFEAISGLRGYVGLDAVWCEGELTVLEINPRITLAYVGIVANPSNISLAAALLQAHGLEEISA